MSSRPLKIPGHRPLSRPEDRDRPFAQQQPRRDPRLGAPARCLSRGARRGGSAPPQTREVVVGREVALRRLARTAEVHAEMRQPLAEVRRELIDVLLHLRVHSLEVVEAIERWRMSSNRNGAPWIDPSSGENYLLKMKVDTLWLADSPLGEIMTFSSKSDPFFVVPSARESANQASTNQMTPTLQARRQVQGERRKAVLPLQASLLRRIHKAELAILRESVQARLSQAAADPPASAHAYVLPVQQAEKPSSFATASEPSKPPVSLQEQRQYSKESIPQVRQSSIVSTVHQQATRTPLPPGAPQPYLFYPLDANETSFGNVLEQYLARVDPRVLLCIEGRQTLESLLQGGESGGPEALEFFWLFESSRKDEAERLSHSDRAAEEADGLFVFQLKKTSVGFGQLLHFSLATRGKPKEPMNSEAYYEALVAVKSFMFCCLPIRSLRVTLWYSIQGDESYNTLPELLDVFKKTFFRWFQLKNTDDGRRGQVMNRPRGTPDDGDPEAPEEVPSIRICWGQTWFRGASMLDHSATRRFGSSATNSVLSALCLKELWKRDAAEVAKIVDWDVAAADTAKAIAREGLIQCLLKGQLAQRLANFAPAAVIQEHADPMSAGHAKSYASKGMAAGFAMHLAKTLHSEGKGVPGAQCEVGDEAVELVQRLSKKGGFGEACEGVGLETLPGLVAGLKPKDASFGRLFMGMDWHTVVAVDDQTFEVPLMAAGRVPWHPHPISYVQTTDEDIYVVVIPFAGVADAPREDQAFTCATEMLRAIEPVDPMPFSSIRLTSFNAASPVRMTEIEDGSALRGGGASALHVAEFGTLLLSHGRVTPGRLAPALPAAGSQPPSVVQKPFIIAFWHAGLDELNVPLAATLVA